MSGIPKNITKGATLDGQIKKKNQDLSLEEIQMKDFEILRFLEGRVRMALTNLTNFL